MLPVSVAVEGQSDVAVVGRILNVVGCTAHAVYGRSGKAALNASLVGYNRAAQFSPWVVVRDLDFDASCAAELARLVLPRPTKWMRFRVAVREMEAWLLGDSEAISRYLRVAESLVPQQPDLIRDPKQALVNLARRSKARSIREDMVPEAGVSATVGPGYVTRISEFASDHWRPDVARLNSPSLNKCIERVAELLAFGTSTRGRK